MKIPNCLFDSLLYNKKALNFDRLSCRLTSLSFIAFLCKHQNIQGMKYINLLFLLLLQQSTNTPHIECKLYFTNSQLKIHGSQDISQFPKNHNNIMSMIKSFENLKNKLRPPIKFTEDEIAANAHLEFMHHQMQLFKQPDPKITILINKTFTNLERQIDHRSKHMKKLVHQATRDFEESVGYKIDSINIHKREIPIIGELVGDIIHDISDIPGPRQFAAAEKKISNLENVIKGEDKEIFSIEKTLHDNAELMNKIIPVLDNFTSNIKSIETLDEILIGSISDEIKINDYALIIEDHINDFHLEALRVKSIIKMAFQKLPSEHMFPAKQLLPIIENHQHKSGISMPFFSSEKEVHEIFSLPGALTSVRIGKIDTLLTIPILDETYSYDIIPYPRMSEKDTSTISQISTIAFKSVDTFLCNSVNRHLAIFTSADLQSCIGWKGKYVCEFRHIRMNGNTNPCQNFSLPEVIAIELDRDTVLLRTSQNTSIDIRCHQNTSTIHLKPTFTKIQLHEMCAIYGKQIFIDNYEYKNFTLDTVPFKIIEISEIELYQLPINDDVNDQFITIKKLSNKIRSDIKIVEQNGLERHERLINLEKSAEEKETPFYLPILSKYIFPIFGSLILSLMIVSSLLYYKLRHAAGAIVQLQTPE